MEYITSLISDHQLNIVGILRRANSLLETVKDVQQDAKADYWFKLGLKHKEAEEWQFAYWCFEQTVKSDNLHWRGWLSLGLCCAHAEEQFQYKNAIVSTDINSSYIPEADLSKIYIFLELNCLFNFLQKKIDGSNEYYYSIALASVHFHNRKPELAEKLLVDILVNTNMHSDWRKYFLRRIEFEKGHEDKSIATITLPLESELDSNSKVHFWLGRSCCQSVLSLKNNYWIQGEADYHLPPAIELRIKIGILHIEKAIAIGPVKAEHYFTLGQLKQLLETPRWRGSGAGLYEYHDAVKLEPGNQQYIMARASAASHYWELHEEQVLELVARVEAADIDVDSPHSILYDLFSTGNYASWLLILCKTKSTLNIETVIAESNDQCAMDWLTECTTILGGMPNMKEIQALAGAERAGWHIRLTSRGL